MTYLFTHDCLQIYFVVCYLIYYLILEHVTTKSGLTSLNDKWEIFSPQLLSFTHRDTHTYIIIPVFHLVLYARINEKLLGQCSKKS